LGLFPLVVCIEAAVMGGGSIGYVANGFVSHSHLSHLVTKHPGWVIKVSHDSPVDYLSGGIPGIPGVNLINESCQNASTKGNYIQKKSTGFHGFQ
jgi:hypothetical protein